MAAHGHHKGAEDSCLSNTVPLTADTLASENCVTCVPGRLRRGVRQSRDLDNQTVLLGTSSAIHALAWIWMEQDSPFSSQLEEHPPSVFEGYKAGRRTEVCQHFLAFMPQGLIRDLAVLFSLQTLRLCIQLQLLSPSSASVKPGVIAGISKRLEAN